MGWKDSSPRFQAVGVSFLALTTDMVGRPTDSTPYTESPTGWPSPGAGPSAIGAVHQGPPRVAIPSRSIGPRSEWADSLDVVLGHESKIRPAQADMVQSGLRRGIEGGQRLRPWAIRQAVIIGSWIMSWSDGDGLPDDGVAQSILGNGLSRLGLRQDAAPVDEHDDSPNAKAPWIRLVSSPSVVILSVAAIAQFCWRATRAAEAAKGIEAGRVEPRR